MCPYRTQLLTIGGVVRAYNPARLAELRESDSSGRKVGFAEKAQKRCIDKWHGPVPMCLTGQSHRAGTIPPT